MSEKIKAFRVLGLDSFFAQMAIMFALGRAESMALGCSRCNWTRKNSDRAPRVSFPLVPSRLNSPATNSLRSNLAPPRIAFKIKS